MFRLYVYERLSGRHAYRLFTYAGLVGCLRVCRALPVGRLRAYELVDGRYRRVSVRQPRDT